jgi:orotidine-5'-phosphate decarboxylase
MNKKTLVEQIFSKKTFLCVGLDTELSKIPPHLLETEDPIFEFNKAIIDATKDHCVAYKPNIAFYEAMGVKGWISLEKTLNYIPKTHFSIADAKRGDIGNTSRLYAQTFFQTYNFDSITVAPYMGEDSVSPFLEFEEKWVILLGLTSNIGSNDFQFSKNENQEMLYEQVLKKSQHWGNDQNMMYVIGATHPEKFEAIRKITPNHFYLVPGVGAQGGDLEKIAQYGMNQECGLLVNAARNIIYASKDVFFAEKANEEAQKLQNQMKKFL